ncbi:MAG: tetratricopeptide repeat protein, partial [Bacteroidaceae bacterium]|nr:tetratricopeptide repeat protein [Bacteroidaceae bacterium]
PQSEYGEEGHSELGNTYISLNKHTEAINTYKALIEKYPMSSSARIAMLQTGAIYYNLKDIDNAIAAYKNLIIQHPTSNEAKVAVEDLQSIYIEQNQIDDLLAFMQQQNIDYHKDEIDSLTYIAAEKKYMTQADTKPFEKYV